jgi:hypothetical protein
VYEIRERKEITAVSIRNAMLGKEEEKQVHTLVEVFEYHNEQSDNLPKSLEPNKTPIRLMLFSIFEPNN